ncbi:MAG: hypothetical protein JSW54_00070 [Fidelibacterota bacterium]|nr:MAG: hypothetical protein JSW54_00070 [Candidatus Neomarinimicrobiota bacterium]
MMSHRYVYALLLGFIFSVTFVFAVHYGKGPKPASTNAPGETSCQAGRCHSQYELNGGDGALTVEGVPGAYAPGQKYELTITIAQKGQKRWGFQITALDTNNLPAGGFYLLEKELTQQVQLSSSEGSPRRYVQHTLEGSYLGKKNGPVSWKLEWEAPDKPMGTVLFYTAGNAANFDKKPWGDFIYTHIDTSREAQPK